MCCVHFHQNLVMPNLVCCTKVCLLMFPYAISNSKQRVYYSYQWNRRILGGGSLNFERTIGSRSVNVSRIKEPSITVLSMTLKNWWFSSKNRRFSSCYRNFFPKKNLIMIIYQNRFFQFFENWNVSGYIIHGLIIGKYISLILRIAQTLVWAVGVLCVYGLRLTLYASVNGRLEYIGSISRPKLGIDGIEALWELLLNKYKVPIGGWMHKV